MFEAKESQNVILGMYMQPQQITQINKPNGSSTNVQTAFIKSMRKTITFNLFRQAKIETKNRIK